MIKLYFNSKILFQDALARINSKLGFVADMLEEEEEILEEHFEMEDTSMEDSNSTMENDNQLESMEF